MKFTYFFIAAIGVTASCNNRTSSAAVKGEPINIPATRVILTPPPGFRLTKTFPGFQKNDNCGINVMDLAGGNFNINAGDMSRESLEQKGVTVNEYKDTTIGGYPAKFAIVLSQPGITSMMEVFGDSSFSVLLMGTYPSNDRVTASGMRESFFTVRYDKSLKVDALGSARFTIDDSKSRFKFSTLGANNYVYTPDGVKVDPRSDIINLSKSIA